MSENKNLPFISVIIPTCDRPDTIVDAISAILANDYPLSLYEVIIVDQGADSRTKDAIQKHFSSKEAVIYLHSPVKCCSTAKNLGAQNARGDILAFTDDDATVDKNWLNAYAGVFREKKDKETIGLAGGPVIPFFQCKRPVWLPSQREYLLPAFDPGGDLRPFPQNSQPIGVNLAILRSLFITLGGFDTRVGLKNDAEIPYITGEDTLLSIRARESGCGVYYQPAAIVYHPVTRKRSTRCFFLRRNFREGVTFLAIENAREALSQKSLKHHIHRHIKRVCWHGLRLIKNLCIPSSRWSKAVMFSAAQTVFSLGVIYYARYLQEKNAVQVVK